MTEKIQKAINFSAFEGWPCRLNLSVQEIEKGLILLGICFERNGDAFYGWDELGYWRIIGKRSESP